MKGDQTTFDLFEETTDDSLDLFEAGEITDFDSMTLNTENLNSDIDIDFLSNVDDITFENNDENNTENSEINSIFEDANIGEKLKDDEDSAKVDYKNLEEKDEEFNVYDVTAVNLEDKQDVNLKESQFSDFEKGNDLMQKIEIQKQKNTTTVTRSLNITQEYGKVNIMAIGIGGAGCNAINRMYGEQLNKIKLVAMDTSRQTLDVVSADYKLLLGKNELQGHGSGNDVDIATEAILDSKEEIRSILEGVDMLFLAAGIGRGTGSAGLAEVGKIAKELGILTIGFAILPGRIEADMTIIEKYYNSFVDAVDSNIVIENDKVNKVAADMPIGKARKIADQMLIDGIKGISDLITNPGKINLDYADIRTAFQNQGSCVMGIGYGENENAVVKAIENSINDEIIDSNSISTAQTIIFNITCARNSVTIEEAAEGTELIYSKNSTHNIKHMLFGYSYDDTLENKVKVTFIATGTKPIDFDSYKKETKGPAPIFNNVGKGSLGNNLFQSVGSGDSNGKPDFFS